VDTEFVEVSVLGKENPPSQIYGAFICFGLHLEPFSEFSLLMSMFAISSLLCDHRLGQKADFEKSKLVFLCKLKLKSEHYPTEKQDVEIKATPGKLHPLQIFLILV